MHPVKVIIQKKVPGKYFKPVPKGRIIIDKDSKIKTEAQFCKFIYDNWGEGRYLCQGFQKGYLGLWAFWLGEIQSNGFIRDKNENWALKKLKKKMKRAKSIKKRDEIEDDMEFEREYHNEIKKLGRRGPIIIKRAKIGVLNEYEEY